MSDAPDALSQLPPGLKLKFDDPSVLDTPAGQQALQRLIERHRNNPLLGYYPHAKQRPFHANKTKIRVFLGGERSGKTVSGVLQDLIDAVDEDALPEHLIQFKTWWPPFRCRVITPDFGRGMQEILNTLQQWVPPGQLYKGSWEHAYSDKNHVLKFANGSFIEFMTQEQDISKFGGTSRHRIHWDEEPKGTKGEELRNANVNRLVEYRGDELFTFSPVHGLGWTFDEFWEKRGKEISPQVWLTDGMILVNADQDDNPHLDAQGKKEAEEKLPERQREARKSGKFVHSQGLVYESFDPELHVCAKREPEFVKQLVQYDGIDPGVRTTAILFAGFDSDNILWIYDELFLTGRSAVPEYAAEKIRAKRAEWKLPQHPKVTLIDPAGASRDVQTGEGTDKAYYRAGIKTFPAKNDVEAGVFEVLRRIEHTEEGELQPLVYIAENCERLIWEIGRYREEPKADGSFGVVKKDDHGCDVMRYIAMARPLPSQARSRNPLLNKKWVPGTAPAYRPPKRSEGGPLGIFT